MSIRKYFRGLYRRCLCGCGTLIPCLTSNAISKYKNGHINKNKKGQDATTWKGGRIEDHGYWYLYIPEDIHSKKNGYVAEHIYFYTQYHKCCMLPWGVVHHIDPISKGYCNNMIWNLEGMTNKQHNILHKTGNKHSEKEMNLIIHT